MSQSQHAAEFNHDPWAAEYDADVQDESHPIRAGYTAVLDWVVAQAAITPDDVVVDLGIGTGNTSRRVVAAAGIIGVDISQKMMALARPKLAHLPVRFVQADLLGFFNTPRRFDKLISTYAIHHLTETEKGELFAHIARSLTPGGRAVFGDLMFADAAARAVIAAAYRAAGDTDMVETFDEEFFWFVDTARTMLTNAGLTVHAVQQFSQLSWGICVGMGGGG